ncbi:MAG: hypothetical protein ABIU05_20775 [Nitrospirales bacterium]
MMTDILPALTAFARSVFRDEAVANPTSSVQFRGIRGPDNVLRELEYFSSFFSPYQDATAPILKLVFADPDFASIAPRNGEHYPYLCHPGGGQRLLSESLIVQLLSSALVKMYVLRLPHDEDSFITTVLKGFEALRCAAKGEKIDSYVITGLAGITLPEGGQISTPWGVVRPAGPIRFTRRVDAGNVLDTSCVLGELRKVSVLFDRAPDPVHPPFDKADIDAISGRSFHLLALACVLASEGILVPGAPIMTWSTFCLSFFAETGCLLPRLPGNYPKEVDLSDRIPEIEEWAQVVNDVHVSSVDISAKKLVSAVGHRLDPGDALIDAVIVWENLLGTKNEVTFRVSAALAKLLECDASTRVALQKRLTKIYNLRSRLVHGDSIDPTELWKASEGAIVVAIKALRASYKKGTDWLSLSSEKRSNRILLE